MENQIPTPLNSTQQAPPEATIQQSGINQRAAVILSAGKILG